MTEIAIILVVTVCDALRDRWHGDLGKLERWTEKQWRWHVVKWISFYSPLVYILLQLRSECSSVAFLAIFCLILWRVVYTW